MPASDVDGRFRIRARRERSLGRHFREDEERAVRSVGESWGRGCLGQSVYDPFAGKDAAIDDVRPF